MSKRDYYEILGVSRNATDEELKKAYRKLAVTHHPDRNAGDKKSEEQFKEVNEAYQILSEPQKRSAYDRFGHAGVGATDGFGQGFSGGGFSDIFDNIFGDFFGGGASGSQGVDLRYHLQITFEEAAFGVEKKIVFNKESGCSGCNGSGAEKGTKATTCKTCRGAGKERFNQGFFTLTRTCTTCQGRGSTVEHKCKTCHGKGSQKRTHEVSVKIPAGIDTDQRLRVRGEGEASDSRGKPGDLYVQVEVLPHSLFRRQAEHIFLELPLSFSQAALGAELDVPTLAGFTKLKIPQGIQTGEMLRLKGKGVVRLNGNGFGDQIVHVIVETPVSLTNRQRELLEEFEQENVAANHPSVSNFLKKIKEMFK